MDQRKTAVERAFELARTGAYPYYYQLARDLKKEGYDPQHFEGREIRKQLAALMKEAKTARARQT